MEEVSSTKMFPGMNPRKMQQMMRQMGVQQEEINAQEVIIRTPDKDIIVVNPSVIKVNMMGQETLQITGQIKERPRIEKTEEISLEDIETVQEQTGATAQAARQALEEANGDLAEAILALKKED